MPYLLCRATQSWGVELEEWRRCQIGLYYIDRWRITIQRAYFMQILCIILKVMTKIGGTNTLLVPVPNQKVGGDLSPTSLPRSPWLLRLCAKPSLYFLSKAVLKPSFVAKSKRIILVTLQRMLQYLLDQHWHLLEAITVTFSIICYFTGLLLTLFQSSARYRYLQLFSELCNVII